MKTSTWVILGVAGIVLYETYQKSSAANDINVIFSGLSIKNLNDIQVQITVQNVTNASITVNSLVGNLLLNGNQVAAISDFNTQTIIPNGQTTFTVDVSPSWLSIIGDVQTFLSTTGTELNFTAVGNVNIAGLPYLPFNLQQTVTV